MIKSLLAKALKGETRASSVLLNLIVGLELAKMNLDEDPSLSDNDQKILEAYALSLAEKNTTDTTKEIKS